MVEGPRVIQPGEEQNTAPSTAVAPETKDAPPAPQPNDKLPDDVQDENAVSWTASEFVSTSKNAKWFVGFGVFMLILAVLIYFWIHDLFSSIVIVVIGIIFAVAAARQPRTLNYQVDSTGLHIGTKFYPYSEFKTFSVAEEGATNSIVFTPFKRFMPAITVYYDLKDEERILTLLAIFLPHLEAKKDPVDQFMRRIRF